VSDATIEGWEAARLRMVVMLGAYSAELADDDDDGAELFSLIVDEAVGVVAAE
jgi:hypothetical protein